VISSWAYCGALRRMFLSLCTAQRWIFVARHASVIARCRPAFPSMMQTRRLQAAVDQALEKTLPRRTRLGAADLEAHEPLGPVAEDGDSGQHGRAGDTGDAGPKARRFARARRADSRRLAKITRVSCPIPAALVATGRPRFRSAFPLLSERPLVHVLRGVRGPRRHAA
jgi:hypothetical protein